MSRQGRDWAEAQRVPNLTLAAVLFKLGHHADPRGLVYRSQATLADLCSCDVKTIRRSLRKLEEMGLIRREERLRRDGSRSSDHIHLNMPEEAEASSLYASTSGLNARGVEAQRPEGGGREPPLTTFESSFESYRESFSDPDGSAPPGGAGRIDFRKELYERGLGLSWGLPAKRRFRPGRLIGRWVGLGRGDCATVLAAIDAAIEEKVFEPRSWIEARLRRQRTELATEGTRRSESTPSLRLRVPLDEACRTRSERPRPRYGSAGRMAGRRERVRGGRFT